MEPSESNITDPSRFTNPLCSGEDPENFFIDDDEKETAAISRVYYRKAKLICSKCEHIVECAEWGLLYEKYGLWGGLTPLERKEIRRRRKIRVIERE